MANDMINLDAFKNSKPSQAFSSLPMDENLADGIGASFPIISYKGKVWALRQGKDRHLFLRKDDQSPMSYIDVVILRSSPHKSKSYYPKDSFNVDNPEAAGPPLCASIDGVQPDAGVREKQADACAICPRNEFKMSQDGKKRRDCSDFKRLAVLLMPDVAKCAVGEPLLEPVYLPVPAASLKHLANYGQSLASMGHHFSGVVTRISFDPEKPHPEMIFRGQKPLRDEDAGAILPLRSDPTTLRITGDGLQRPAIAPPTPTAASLPANNIVSMKELEARNTSHAPLPKITSTPKHIEHQDGALAAALAAPKQQVVTEAEESDDELDGMIANLMKKAT